MMSSSSKGTRYPVLPLRDIVIFPHMIVPLFVGREKSVHALEEVMHGEEKQVVLVTQKSPTHDDPRPEDLYTVGTLGAVLQLLKLPDGTVKVLVEGGARVQLVKVQEEAQHFYAVVEEIKELQANETEVEALIRTILGQFEQ